MAILKQLPKSLPPKSDTDKSLYMANEKIDRFGRAWEKTSLWLRKDNLGKLNVIAHFRKKSLHEIIDQALEAYLSSKWDDSMAMRKLIGKPKK